MNPTRRGSVEATFVVFTIIAVIILVVIYIPPPVPHLPLVAARIHTGDTVALDARGNTTGVVTAVLPPTSDGEKPRFQVRIAHDGTYQTSTFFIGELYEP